MAWPNTQYDNFNLQCVVLCYVSYILYVVSSVYGMSGGSYAPGCVHTVHVHMLIWPFCFTTLSMCIQQPCLYIRTCDLRVLLALCVCLSIE